MSNAYFSDENVTDYLSAEGYSLEDIEKIEKAYPNGISEDLITVPSVVTSHAVY